ncbi:hypothetical protein F4808DRAFT_462090 [Astrocystis sublimbata]|nr:hypothetical protein F4808DRAFT_462090 [Astrocystis sublimbata]
MDALTPSGTDSDASEDLGSHAMDDSIRLKRVPAFVSWQTSLLDSFSLSDLFLDLDYNTGAKTAQVRLRAPTRLKKGEYRPQFYLFIKPDQIRTLAYIDAKREDLCREVLQHGDSREKLNTATHVLLFELKSLPTFVVSNHHPFSFYRIPSQTLWKAWESFAKDTYCFYLHLPKESVSKGQLESLCKAASTAGALAPLSDDIRTLYGGKGGKVVDPHVHGEDGSAQARTSAGAGAGASGECSNPPPLYHGHVIAGSSAATTVLSPCSSSASDSPRSRKRSREDSDSGSEDTEVTTSQRSDGNIDAKILDAILNLQRTIEDVKTAQEAIIAKVLLKIDAIEERFKKLEECQQDLVDEVRARMEPLWDEMDGRLQSQEDRGTAFIREVVDEAVEEKVDEKLVEAVEGYFANDDDGQRLLRDVLGETIHEETKGFLESRRFSGNFFMEEEGTPLI